MARDVGGPAPQFELSDQAEHPVRLADYADRFHVALIFFSYAFAGDAQSQLRDVLAGLEPMEEAGVQVIGVTCDAPYSLERWAREQSITFPLLSDHWPHGRVAGQFGVFDETRGCPMGALFLIDRKGELVHVQLAADGPLDVERVLDVVQATG